jgi:hypothetical protein
MKNNPRLTPLTVELLTRAAFAPFGDVIELDHAQHFAINGGTYPIGEGYFWQGQAEVPPNSDAGDPGDEGGDPDPGGEPDPAKAHSPPEWLDDWINGTYEGGLPTGPALAFFGDTPDQLTPDRLTHIKTASSTRGCDSRWTIMERVP